MNGFLDEIYLWYSTHKRELPWRKTSDPYCIWLSEIILQQTRVIQGIQYYQRFLETFPNIYTLATADEDEVLKLWQGLGYYSRARNLHFTAKLIVKDFDGKFPASFEELLKLKGIGIYTAAAIASIAFQIASPTVDGNIYRLLSRYFGIDTAIDSNKGKKEFYALAEELIPNHNPGMHNQALMEFGALQCTPRSPQCNICPLIRSCTAFQNKTIEFLPVKEKKVKQRNRYFYYLYLESGDFTFIEKRTGKDIWENLYQFPLIEENKEVKESNLIKHDFSLPGLKNANLKAISQTKKHILSHQIIYAKVMHFELKETSFRSDKYIRVNKKDIYKFAVPRLLEQFIAELKIG